MGKVAGSPRCAALLQPWDSAKPQTCLKSGVESGLPSTASWLPIFLSCATFCVSISHSPEVRKSRPCALDHSRSTGWSALYLYRGIVGKRWCSSCHCMPPHRASENQLLHMASRVERNWASQKSYLRSVSLIKISSDWCVTVTMVAVRRPESHTPRKTVEAGNSEQKVAQWTARRAASFHFLCLST